MQLLVSGTRQNGMDEAVVFHLLCMINTPVQIGLETELDILPFTDNPVNAVTQLVVHGMVAAQMPKH
jgi:hypothetical protein